MVLVAGAAGAAARDRRADAARSRRASPGTSAIATPTCKSVGDRLRIRHDHVLEEMVRGLGATVAQIDAPFDPEAAPDEQIMPQHDMRDPTRALYRLLAWLSPSYPVGAFSYSSGLEWAVEAGDVNDAASAAALACDGGRGGRWLLRCRVVRARLSSAAASGR